MQKQEVSYLKDNSPTIPQRDKFKGSIFIKELPWTTKQKEIIDTILDSKSKIVFVNGNAGTGKSILATYCGLKLLSTKKVSDIIFVRTALEVSDSASLGYLKGDLLSKLLPYYQVFTDKCQELLKAEDNQKLQQDNRVTFVPVNFARGLSWAVKYILMEEANNYTFGEYKLLLTRYGMKSKMVFVGDFSQTDLPAKKQGAFKRIYDLFDNQQSRDNGIYCFSLGDEDIKRSDILGFILKTLDDSRVEPMFPAK